MNLRAIAIAMALTLMGCQEPNSALQAQAPLPVSAPLKSYKYKVTHFYGANDLAIRSRTFLIDEWHYQGDGGWILLVNPKTGGQVWLSGTIEIEEGSFREAAR